MPVKWLLRKAGTCRLSWTSLG